VLVDRVEARTVQRDPQDTRGRTIDLQMREVFIAVKHESLLPTG